MPQMITFKTRCGSVTPAKNQKEVSFFFFWGRAENWSNICTLLGISTSSCLRFSTVEMGNKSLMGVSLSDFAKQVLSMLLLVFLPNRTSWLLDMLQYRYPASNPATARNMRRLALNSWAVMKSITATVDMFKMTINWRSGVVWKGQISRVYILLYLLKGKYMCIINRKDDYVILLVLSCHQFPLGVCANRSVAKEQIRAPLGRVNAP